MLFLITILLHVSTWTKSFLSVEWEEQVPFFGLLDFQVSHLVTTFHKNIWKIVFSVSPIKQEKYKNTKFGRIFKRLKKYLKKVCNNVKSRFGVVLEEDYNRFKHYFNLETSPSKIIRVYRWENKNIWKHSKL